MDLTVKKSKIGPQDWSGGELAYRDNIGPQDWSGGELAYRDKRSRDFKKSTVHAQYTAQFCIVAVFSKLFITH